MDTFASDVKQNIKESLTERFEASTGIIGETLRKRREERERDKKIQKKLGTIKNVTERLQNRSSSISSIEIKLTQISLNLQNIIVSFGERATLQAETDAVMLADKQQQQRERKQQSLLIKEQQSNEKEDNETDSLLDSLAKLLGVFPFGKKTPKPPKKISPKARAKVAAKKAYKAALKKGLSKEAAKQAAKQAQEKALQRALAKEAADKAAKEAAKQAAEKAAKEAAEKAAKEAADKAAKQATKEASEKAAKELQKKAAKETVKKLATSKLATTIGKIGAKSIPFVGAAVGVGFAAWKLVQGDYVGAGVEAVSGLGSAATAIPATIYSTAREIYQETYGVWPESDPKQNERWPALYETVKEAGEELIGKKIDPQPPTPEAKPTPTTTPVVTVPPTSSPSPAIPPNVPSAVAAPSIVTMAPSAPVVAAPPAAPAGAPAAKPLPASAGMSGVAGQLAISLESFGITNPFAKQAIIATAAKESGLNPAAKESGAGAYLKTLASRGLDYIYLVFPQLKPGGRVAKNLGFTETGVPKELIEKEWSKGDESFFDMVYGGLGTNTQVGDGYKYRGRGFIGITGRTVYRNVGKEVGKDLEEKPDLVAVDFDHSIAALAGYFFMARGGKQKALSTLNNFTDQTEALKWTLNTVAGLGHKASEFDVVGSHLNEQLRKASKFLDMSATAVASTPPPTVGTDVGKTTVAVNNMKQQQTQGNDVTVVNMKEKQVVYKQAAVGGNLERMRTVG